MHGGRDRSGVPRDIIYQDTAKCTIYTVVKHVNTNLNADYVFLDKERNNQLDLNVLKTMVLGAKLNIELIFTCFSVLAESLILMVLVLDS